MGLGRFAAIGKEEMKRAAESWQVATEYTISQVDGKRKFASAGTDRTDHLR